jgi:hypothetical protein
MTWRDLLPVTRGEMKRRMDELWRYTLEQTDHVTAIGERVTRLEGSSPDPESPNA